MTALARQRMTLAEYVAQEATSDTRHEYVNGEAFAMAGGSDEHAALAARIITALGRALDGTPFEPRTSDLRVRTASGLTTYPDVTVICGKSEKASNDPHAVTNPTLLVEVMSESSEAYDRGAKFAHYRSLPGLQEYLLVDFREAALTSHARCADGTWITSFAQQGDSLLLRSLDVRLEVDVLYRGMVGDPVEGRLVLAGLSRSMGRARAAGPTRCAADADGAGEDGGGPHGQATTSISYSTGAVAAVTFITYLTPALGSHPLRSR